MAVSVSSKFIAKWLLVTCNAVATNGSIPPDATYDAEVSRENQGAEAVEEDEMLQS